MEVMRWRMEKSDGLVPRPGRSLNFASHPNLHLHIDKKMTGEKATLPLFNKKTIKLPDGGDQGMESRIPGSGWRNHFIAFLSEFVGTFMFFFIAFAGTSVANIPNRRPSSDIVAIAPPETGSNPSQLLYISLSFGFSLAVNAWVFFRISGGLFNPCVTLGLYLTGNLSGIRSLVTFAAQMIGGIVSAYTVDGIFPTPLGVTTTLGAGTSVAQGLFIEAFLTFGLMFTIYMLAAEKHKATFLAPIGIGLSLFIAQLAGVYYTGGSLNPARSFGPAVATKKFPPEHWIYWVGPFIGTLAAVGFYKVVKALHYETANPGQDSAHSDETVVVIHDEPGTGPEEHNGRSASVHIEGPTTSHGVDTADTTDAQPVTGELVMETSTGLQAALSYRPYV